MAEYPDAVFAPRTKANKSGVVYAPLKTTVNFVEDTTKLDDEVVAIETELGTDPKGDFDDVKARLEAGLIRDITFIMDGDGSAITSGIKGQVQIPFDCEIISWTLLGDNSGNFEMDIHKNTYAEYPNLSSKSITDSNYPEIDAAYKGTDTTLTGWTKTISAGDILLFETRIIQTQTQATIILKVKLIE